MPTGLSRVIFQNGELVEGIIDFDGKATGWARWIWDMGAWIGYLNSEPETNRFFIRSSGKVRSYNSKYLSYNSTTYPYFTPSDCFTN